MQVELERGSDGAKLAQSPRLQLSHTFACDAEIGADFFEGLGGLAVEAEAAREHMAHARSEPLQSLRELGRAEMLSRGRVGPLGLRVLDQVAVEALAVADRGLEAHGILDELQERSHALEQLNPRMRLVISRRFGLNGEPPQTLEQVGSELGITRERVRQLESRALRELRTVAPALQLYLRAE